MPFQSTLVLFQAKKEIQSLVDLILKSPEDALVKRTNSRKLILDSNQKSKSIAFPII